MGTREERDGRSPHRSSYRGDKRRVSSDRRTSHDDVPKLYSIFQGEVSRIQQYGVFVRIPGFRKQGLVHRTQMSQGRVEKPEEVVDEGESVFCKVISVEDDKVGLSMKVVNQRTGEDLDKNHVQSSLDEQRRKTGHKREIPRIELGAVLDTTCRKCGGKGHLKQDCYAGAKEYDLLPDVSHLMEMSKVDQDKKEGPKKKQKKEKKHKKKHKHQKEVSSDSEDERTHKKHKKKHKRQRKDSSSDSEDEAAKKKEQKKKKKKKHKRKHESSSSDSSSSDDSDEDRGRHSHKKKRHKSDR